MSETSGKAGGLREREPLKAVDCYREALKAPLVPSVRGVCLLYLAPGCSDARPPRSCPPSTPSSFSPRSAARRSCVFVQHTPAQHGSRFALNEPHHLRHRILRRHRDEHVHVIDHQMPFRDLAFLLPSQFPEDPSKLPPNLVV